MWQMQSTSLLRWQEGATVAGVMVNTGCCDQADFLPLATLFTSTMTHWCPTAHESNYSFTSLTHPLHFAPLPPSTVYCCVQGQPSQGIFLQCWQKPPPGPHSTYSPRTGLSLWIHSWKNQKDWWLFLSLPITNRRPWRVSKGVTQRVSKCVVRQGTWEGC